MRIRPFPALVLISLWATACGPARGGSSFDVPQLPAATSIPMPEAARNNVATFSHRITAFDVSPDARTLAVATSDGVALYDLQTARRLRTVGGRENVGAVAWSGDGSRLAVGGTKDYGVPFFVGGDSTNSNKAHLTVWDTSTWEAVLEPQFGDEMVNLMFYDLAWSPDGSALAFSLDFGGVWVLDAQTGETLSHQTEFSGSVTDVAWSPDGSRLVATNDMAYTIRRWKMSGGQSVRLFDKRVGNAMSLAWSPDGTRIASGHVGGGVCIWTAASNRCDGFVRAHQSATFSLVWSPDGSQMATGGGVIRIWDAHTGRLVTAFGEQQGITYDKLEWPRTGGPLFSLQASFEHPGLTLLRVWDVDSGRVVMEFEGDEVQPQ